MQPGRYGHRVIRPGALQAVSNDPHKNLTTVMATYTDTVGKRVEQAVRSFLENEGYKVIPYGVEHTLQDVVALGTEAYSALRLNDVISSAPDFFVLSPKNQGYWLLEVKYRACWGNLTQSGLKEDFETQARCWKSVVCLIAVKSPVGPDGVPTSHIRVGQLFERGSKLKAHVKSADEGKKWDDLQWDDLYPIEEVFGACCQNEAGKQRLNKLVRTIRETPEHSIDMNLLRKAWKRTHSTQNKA
jgi:hypothetical protein